LGNTQAYALLTISSPVRDLTRAGLLAHTRQTLARQYLADPAQTQTDVAFLLGYSEQSSFIRTFRSWTGTTPREDRTHLMQNRKGSRGRPRTTE